MKNYLIISLIFLLSSCIKEGSKGLDLKPGDPLPSFSVVMMDGSSVCDADLKGSVSLVMFFHTSCPDCQKTLPKIQRLYDEYKDEAVRFLLISREEDAGSIASYWEEHGLTMPYSAQSDRRVYELFARERIPRIYVNGKNGIIRAIFTDNPIPEYSAVKAAIDSSF